MKKLFARRRVSIQRRELSPLIRVDISVRARCRPCMSIVRGIHSLLNVRIVFFTSCLSAILIIELEPWERFALPITTFPCKIKKEKFTLATKITTLLLDLDVVSFDRPSISDGIFTSPREVKCSPFFPQRA